jgi:rSAM/selenodomain-associated transferase 1
MTALLGMFAKHWTPGRVKTRLAAKLGKVRAAKVQRLFVHTLLNRFRAVADERILEFDPPHEVQDFQRAASSLTTLPASSLLNQHEESQPAANAEWQTQPQAPGDLGERMAAFFDRALARAERVVLIGSDSPDLPSEFVAEAFAALKQWDLVLGPADDGGYYLVGAARRLPPIFAGMPWSTANLWSATIQQLQQADCRWHALPRWYDVDTAQDLVRLRLCLDDSRKTESHLGLLADRLTALVAEPAT